MGNFIVRDLVLQKYSVNLPMHSFDNVILNSAAVKQQKHAKWVEKMNFQNNIYITSNENDHTLKGAMILRVALLLGLEYKGPLAQNATYINFTGVGGEEHNLFIGRTSMEKYYPQIYSFYNSVFHGNNPHLNNDPGFVKSEIGDIYYIQPNEDSKVNQSTVETNRN